MNDRERELIRCVCDGDIRKAQQVAHIVLSNLTTQKDTAFKKYNLARLDNKGPDLIDLPANLKDKLAVEDVSSFPEDRFLLRPSEEAIVENVLLARKAANRLSELKINYVPAAILYGESGTGKTMLARYIAYRADLPFAYVRFSGLIDSFLGGTQRQLNLIFDYVRTNPCVLCLDEMDYIGMKRGQKDDVGEMNRIVVALMQELDHTNNGCILIGTTNRFDRLDPALVRRFPIHEEVIALDGSDAEALVHKYLSSVDMLPCDSKVSELVCAAQNTNQDARGMPGLRATPDAVVNVCKQYIISVALEQAQVGTTCVIQHPHDMSK